MQSPTAKLNRQQKELLWILLAQAVICLVIWREVRFGHITQGIAVAWFVTDFATAMTLRLLQLIRGILIVFGVVAAALSANLVDLVYEISADPALQKLYLLQLVVTLVIAVFASVIGVGLASTFRPHIGYEDRD